jgi:hypothetical protein
MRDNVAKAMATAGLVALRRDRVRNAFSRVEADVEAWLGRWTEDRPQTSQITRCGAVLRGMLAHLGARLAELPADERALAAGRAIEWDLTLVEGLSRLLEERFQQRRDSALAPTLQAADELIWSCVQPTRDLTTKPLPLPLAYIDPAFSPSATPRTKPPTALPARDRLLAGMLRVLPVPLIGLPTGIVDEPWWLVLIAHEVGHHVQYDVEDDEDVVKRTGAALKEATGDATWESWRHEVFADLFAVLTLGPVAIEATEALEWDVPENMAAAKNLYPPVIVRLALMAECAAAVGYTGVPFRADSWADTLAQVSAPRREAVAAQLSRVPDAVAAVLGMRIGGGTLRWLAGKAPPAGAGSDPIAAALRRKLRGENVSIKRSKELPRSAVREAFRAYRGLAATADPAQRAATADPAQRAATADPAQRAATADPAQRAATAKLEQAADERRRLRERTVSVIAESGELPGGWRKDHDEASNAAIVDRMFEVLREAEAEAGAEGGPA